MASAKQVASNIGNATVDIASTTATVTGNVAADSLTPAATVSALVPGGQGISAALNVADVVVNGGLAEAAGAASGATTSALVGDVLTYYGSKSSNLGVRVLFQATNQSVSRAADLVITQELKK